MATEAKEKKTIPAENFLQTVAANVDNSNLTDAAFRQLCRNSLPIVIGVNYPPQPLAAAPQGSDS